jgi:hypothetical protein
MQTAIQSGLGEVVADYTSWLPLANDPPTLVARLNLLLTANQLASSTISTITNAVASIAVSTDANRLSRLYAAILLVMATPEYLVQK